MYKNTDRPSWVEINLKNLDYNIKQIKKKIGDKQIIGVIKADAYGHGAVQCAKVLIENGVKMLAVATLDEAIKLRENNINEEIIILGLTPSLYKEKIVKYDLTPVVCDSNNALEFNDEAIKQGKIINVIIALDTGMGRIGYLADNIEESIEDISRYSNLSNLHIQGLLSHFSCADEHDKTYASIQYQKYLRFYSALKEKGINIEIATLANSASIIDINSSYFDAVRPGIILYGYYPSNEVNKQEIDLKPVMSVKANIVHLKELDPNSYVGYGRKYKSDRKVKIATINLGYADGLPRCYAPFGKVIVNGIVCPIAGNICMDQFMVDVTDVSDVKLYDEVIIMNEQIDANYIAQYTNTINYEVLCNFGLRLPKVYIK